MDPPFGHVSHHHHHNRRDDDHGAYPPPPHFSSSPYPPPPQQTYPPPPPHYGGTYDPPPPPNYGGTHDPPPPAGIFHSSHHTAQPHFESENYPPPPSPPSPPRRHRRYGNEEEVEEMPHHGFRPHMPAFIAGHFNQHSGYDHAGGGSNYGEGGPNYDIDSVGPHLDALANKLTYKIYSKAGGDRLCVGVREGKIVLADPNPDDPTQHWYKDEKYSIRVKDKDGYPSFILVNKGTGQATKHPVSGHPVQLVPYNPDVLDQSVLWTESKDLGSGFRTIRTVNNVKLVMDAWNADQKHGSIHDGTLVALFDVWKGDNQNQQWKIVPY